MSQINHELFKDIQKRSDGNKQEVAIELLKLILEGSSDEKIKDVIKNKVHGMI